MEMLSSFRGDNYEFCLAVTKFMHVRSCPSRWRVLIPSGSMAVDELDNRIASFVSAGVDSKVFVAGFSMTCPVRLLEVDVGSPRSINHGQF